MSAPVTLVIATNDRRAVLMRTLAVVGAQPHRPPVIVVDDGSFDGTPEMIRDQFSWVHLVPLAASAGPSARNVGVALAGTPLVAFADDDSWYEEGALDAAAEIFDARPRLGLIAGQVLVGPLDSLDPTCVAMAAGPLRGFLACAAIVRREAFMAVGGFHRWMSTGGEEEYVATRLARARWELEYHSELVVHHWPPGRTDRLPRRRALARNAALTDFLLRPRAEALATTIWRTMRQLSANEAAGTLEGIAAGIWTRDSAGSA